MWCAVSSFKWTLIRTSRTRCLLRPLLQLLFRVRRFYVFLAYAKILLHKLGKMWNVGMITQRRKRKIRKKKRQAWNLTVYKHGAEPDYADLLWFKKRWYVTVPEWFFSISLFRSFRQRHLMEYLIWFSLSF